MKSKLAQLVRKMPFFKEIKFFIYRLLRPKYLYLLSSTTKPISDLYGIDRGKPVDRVYIERFLDAHKQKIRGTCLELLNNSYTQKYGDKQVVKSDILDIDPTNTSATIIGDIRNLTNVVPDESYDCIILTQVLQFIDDYDTALLECKRILKPNGHILITVPSISRIDCAAGVAGDYWRFTEASMQYILNSKFKTVEINSHGNARVGMSFLIGLSQEDTSNSIYNKDDRNFPLIITAVVTK